MLAKIGLLAAHGSRPITGRKNGQHEPRAGHTMENQGLLQRPVSTTASWIKLFLKLVVCAESAGLGQDDGRPSVFSSLMVKHCQLC